MEKKRIAVIGAGASGLTSTKSCLEEDLQVVCYEKTDFIGGLWRYRDEDVEGFGSVMKSTVINTNKELNAFSDFPPPNDFPPFMHNSLMVRYMEMYAEKFKLLQHVKFQHEIIKVEKCNDFEESGRWLITVRNNANGNVCQEIFDGVMICTGHHVTPRMPTYPDQEKFVGGIMHSHSYKKSTGFEDKTVLVVGVGNSGVDIAVELSSVCKQVYLSARRGCWVFPRVGRDGLPNDMQIIRRINAVMYMSLPRWLTSMFVMKMCGVNCRVYHFLDNLKPKHDIFAQHPTVNDLLPNKIINGTVIVKPNIRKFTSSGVVFDEDDAEEIKVDVVVVATGYAISFPFLDEDVLSVQDNRVELYKLVFPPRLKHPTIAFIGLVQIVGSIFPHCEAQARLFALVMTKKVRLPTQSEMLEDIKQRNEKNAERYYNSPRHTIQADWVEYMDEIAILSGTKPNFWKMAFTNPRLFYACIFGPSAAYHYRLTGPHNWDGAEEAILRIRERMIAGLNAKKSPRSK